MSFITDPTLRGRIIGAGNLFDNNGDYFDGMKNLAYIVIFLRNGGERLRAIWLAKSALKIEIKEASEWVDSVSLVNEPAPDLLPEIPPRNVEVSDRPS